jgi:site-specific DNA-methyltransferase (adenine-specific)
MVSKTLFSSNTEEWGTPLTLYKKLDEEFHFETDPCTTQDNPLKTYVFYTKKENGLKQKWYGNTFINPPYGKNAYEWVKEAAKRQNENTADTIVMLLPARTDTKWFHEYILNKPNIEIRFLKGRITFVGATNPAPFPSMIVIFHIQTQNKT